MNIDIIGIIGKEVRAQDIRNQLANITPGQVEPVNVYIMSDGGSVVEGLAIFNALRAVSSPTNVVNVHIEFAASIAATVAMAGDKITMASNGRLMIHNPMAKAVYANAADLRQTADELDRRRVDMVNSFARTGMKRDKIQAMMDKETYLDAIQAKEFGFIDGITEASQLVAELDKTDLLAWSDKKQQQETENMNYLTNLVSALLGSDNESAKKAGAELNDVVAERDRLKAESELFKVESEKAVIIAEMRNDGKLTDHDCEAGWLTSMSVDNLKAFALRAPVVVAIDGKTEMPKAAPEPKEQIKSESTGPNTYTGKIAGGK